MFFMFDPAYLLVMGVTLAFSMWASARVKWALRKYRKVPAVNGRSGAEVAQLILQSNGLTSVNVEPTSPPRVGLMQSSGDGIMNDHYDPRSRTVRLSPEIYRGTSVAAQAIAAHEVGHALQHAQAYAPMMLRNRMVPAVNLGSQLAYPLILLGFFMHTFSMIQLGIILFSLAVVFQIITLPVEIDASNRAKRLLGELGLATSSDRQGTVAVLNAAAWTYVAAAAAAALNLLYLLWRTGIIGGRR